MKYPLLLFSLIILSGCWNDENPIKIKRPVKTATVEPLENYTKEFAGVVTAPNYTNLAFGVSGTVQQICVSTGETIKRGQVVALLDDADYKLQLAAEESSYLTAKAALERAENMYQKEAISLQELQSTRARYDLNFARWEYAKSQLENCTLRSPLNGFVEKTFVTDFQNITTSEMVLRIIDPTVLEIDFTLPLSDIEMSRLLNDFTVEFPSITTQRFATRIKEVVDASINGAGIPVTLSITDSLFDAHRLNIKAGFACTVRVNIEGEYTAQNYTTVPLSAIFSPVGSDDKFVWVYNPSSSNVKSQRITTSGMVGSNLAIVESGLSAGAKVVTAGVYQIEENQTVNLLPQ